MDLILKNFFLSEKEENFFNFIIKTKNHIWHILTKIKKLRNKKPIQSVFKRS